MQFLFPPRMVCTFHFYCKLIVIVHKTEMQSLNKLINCVPNFDEGCSAATMLLISMPHVWESVMVKYIEKVTMSENE